MDIRLAPLCADDVPQAQALTQQLRWPHRLADWQQAWRLGEGLAALEQDRVIGTLLYWRWGRRATLGLVVVDPQRQRCGIGQRLMQAALARLGDVPLRLHATEAGVSLYRRWGFIPAGRVVQQQTASLPARAAPPLPPGWQRRAARRDDLWRLARWDHAASGFWRPTLMHALLSDAQQVTVVRSPQRDEGMVAVRRFGHGYQIGPLLARTPFAARWLLADALASLAGEVVRVDSEAAAGLGDWLTQRGLCQVDAPTLMVRGAPWQPRPGGMKAFALYSQALA
ncbi:GNAT family N-acetyltransferase [Pantoea sp. 1.19]|uniref:GNAT family N-acetyltransferase n=1 Tax=Pantoea sp. 1.19 TaxID=1925589 RepID=UPI000948C559|nr:GNAT family N-acetyltransferase [Pantoea sp. 1.19]